MTWIANKGVLMAKGNYTAQQFVCQRQEEGSRRMELTIGTDVGRIMSENEKCKPSIEVIWMKTHEMSNQSMNAIQSK